MTAPVSVLGDAILDIQDGDKTYRLVRVMTRSGPQTLEVPIEYILPMVEATTDWLDGLAEYLDGPDFPDDDPEENL